MQIEGFEAQTNEAKWNTITIRKHRINSKQNQNLRIVLSIHSYVVIKKRTTPWYRHHLMMHYWWWFYHWFQVVLYLHWVFTNMDDWTNQTASCLRPKILIFVICLAPIGHRQELTSSQLYFWSHLKNQKHRFLHPPTCHIIFRKSS